MGAYNASNPKIMPVLDNAFIPASIEYRNFTGMVEKSGKGIPLVVSLEKRDGMVSTWETKVFQEGIGYDDLNIRIVERLIKSLVWLKGGWKLYIGGPGCIGRYLANAYATGGARSFDAEFMSKIYEKPFTVVVCSPDKVPEANELSKPLGRHFNGCRIGLDLGGSDRKVSAVIDGVPVFSEEKIWHPKTMDNPDYHYKEILEALKTAASKMSRVDAIGVSAAGIYINNRVMAASLFILDRIWIGSCFFCVEIFSIQY